MLISLVVITLKTKSNRSYLLVLILLMPAFQFVTGDVKDKFNTDPYGIPPYFIKQCQYILQILFNISLLLSTFLTVWKNRVDLKMMSKTIVLFLLCLPYQSYLKSLPTIFYVGIVKINSHQLGFMRKKKPKKSTTTNLLYYRYHPLTYSAVECNLS